MRNGHGSNLRTTPVTTPKTSSELVFADTVRFKGGVLRAHLDAAKRFHSLTVKSPSTEATTMLRCRGPSERLTIYVAVEEADSLHASPALRP